MNLVRFLVNFLEVALVYILRPQPQCKGLSLIYEDVNTFFPIFILTFHDYGTLVWLLITVILVIMFFRFCVPFKDSASACAVG